MSAHEVNVLRRVPAVVSCALFLLLCWPGLASPAPLPGNRTLAVVGASVEGTATRNSTRYRHQRLAEGSPGNTASGRTNDDDAGCDRSWVATDQSVAAAAQSRSDIGVTGAGNFVKFAILLPEQPSKRRDVRILSTVLPVIEMAKNAVTAPGGLLPNFRIEIDHRDTQCSSTFGALGAFDIFLKRKPGENAPR